MQEVAFLDVLDRAKQRMGVTSDYAVCKALGFSAQKMNHWRHGRVLPDEKATQLLGSAAGMDPDYLCAMWQAQRISDPVAKQAWLRIAERLREHPIFAVFSVPVSM